MDKTGIEKVRRFAKQLPFKAQVFLFGSRVSNDYMHSSDFDVIIVSDYFEGISVFDRLVLVDNHWKEKEPLEPFCYTPAEFRNMKKRITTVSMGLRNSIEIQ